MARKNWYLLHLPQLPTCWLNQMHAWPSFLVVVDLSANIYVNVDIFASALIITGQGSYQKLKCSILVKSLASYCLRNGPPRQLPSLLTVGIENVAQRCKKLSNLTEQLVELIATFAFDVHPNLRYNQTDPFLLLSLWIHLKNGFWKKMISVEPKHRLNELECKEA